MALTVHRKLRKDFPTLGDDVWVEMRNPRMLPMDRLQPQVVIRTLPDGSLDPEHAREVGCQVAAGLVTAWHVFDATDDSDDPRWLEQINGETFRLLPAPVEIWIGTQMNEATSPS